MDSIKQAFDLLFSLDKELFQILGVTLRMSFFSTSISCLIGLPLGALIGTRQFRGKSFLKKLIHTLMGLPPVVAGLLVYMLFTHYGPFGRLHLLFTVTAMVIAQCVLITPLVMGLTASKPRRARSSRRRAGWGFRTRASFCCVCPRAGRRCSPWC